MRFKVTIHDRVMQQLDDWLGFDVSSQLISDLYKQLPLLTAADRQARFASEPEVFHLYRTLAGYGIWQDLDIAVNDGWEPDRLHVVGVKRTTGGRAF